MDDRIELDARPGLEARVGTMASARRVLLVALLGLCAWLVAIAAGCAPQSAAATLSVSGKPSQDAGKQLFQANCAVCHGENGDRVPVAPLNTKQFLDSRGDATLTAVISEGKGVMPAWGKARGGPLSDDEVRNVVAYLNSAVGRTSPAILAGQGRAVFEQNCTRCHGDKGDRVPVAPLGVKAFIDSRTDAQLVQVISDGRDIMPSFKNAKPPLSPDQITAVVAYLRHTAEVTLSEQARHGRELYLATCLACHGERGDRLQDIALASPAYLRKLGEGALITSISGGKDGQHGLATAGRGGFEVREVASVLIYLKSWAGLPASAAVAATGTAGQAAATAGSAKPDARILFTANCASCHGDGGDKIANVRLKNKEFLDARADADMARVISRGNARGMPGWGQAQGGPLSDADIQGLIAYLRGESGSRAPAASAQAALAPGSVEAPKPAAPAPAASPAPAAAAKPAALTSAPVAGDPAKGKQLIAAKGCGACHKVPGVDGANGAVGPDLAGVAGRAKLAGGAVTNGGPDDLKKWLIDPPALKAGTAMPKVGLSNAEAQDITAYFHSLDKPAGGAGAGGAVAAGPAQTSALAGDPARGKQLIAAKGCGVCHKVPGVDGANGAVGPDLAGVAGRAKLAGGAVANGGPDDLKKWLIDPPSLKAGTAMPKVGLSEAEAGDIVAYFQSLEKSAGGAGGGASSASGPAAAAPPDPAANDPTQPLVATNALVGRELFTKNCVACHGEDGMRQPNCPLGSKEWLNNMSDQALELRIWNGKPNGGMPAWSKRKGGPLSDSQVRAIILFLAQLVRQNAAASGAP